MSERLLEVIIPKGKEKQVEEVLSKHTIIFKWQDTLPGDKKVFKVLLPVEESEPVLDKLEKKFPGEKHFRVLIYSIEATIPRPSKKEELEKEKQKRVSREEIYSDVVETVNLSPPYITLIILSSIVAAIGIIHDNVAVIIGAMVIAPLLGPNVAMSLATTLADTELAYRALKSAVAGILIGLAVSILIGSLIPVDPGNSAIISRTNVDLLNIVLALASGGAGALAFTTGISTALVGVMVAVALLPPLVTFGLLVGSANLSLALGALLLFMSNLICINLSGVLTFLIQGIRPISWWEAEKAKKATFKAVVLWIILLITLIGIIVLSQENYF